VVHFGEAINFGEGIALVTQAARQEITGIGHQLLGKYLPFTHDQQRLELLLVHHQVAGQLDVTDLVAFPLNHIGGNEYFTTIRRYRHLGRFQRKVDVTTVQVEGAKFLKISRQALARILVVTLDERPEMRWPKLETLEYLFVGEKRVANDIDIADARRLAFVDIDLQLDPVARQRHHLAVDAGAITALGHILALQFRGNAFQGRAPEYLALGQARLLQSLAQLLLVNRLVAVEFNARNHRSLGYHDHQHITIAADLHILEVTTGIQALDRIGQLRRRYRVALVNHQVTEHALDRQALQPFDADITYTK